MARTIWKFPAAAQTADVGNDPTIVHFGIDPQGTPCVWIEHEPTEALRPFNWYIVGTGHEVPADFLHMGACVDGPFVWHVYEPKGF